MTQKMSALVAGEVNWYCPGGFSTGDPSGVQALKGKARLVVASAVKLAPEVLVKEIWKEPLANRLAIGFTGTMSDAWATVTAWPSTVMLTGPGGAGIGRKIETHHAAGHTGNRQPRLVARGRKWPAQSAVDGARPAKHRCPRWRLRFGGGIDERIRHFFDSAVVEIGNINVPGGIHRDAGGAVQTRRDERGHGVTVPPTTRQ